MRILPSAFLFGLLAIVPLSGGAAELIGRLFLTVEQRSELDALREAGGNLPVDDGAQEPSVPPSAERRVVMNGVIRRRFGPDVVWVNGSRTGAAAAGIRVGRGGDASNRVILQDSANGSTARLKPGQYWEPATGRVADCDACESPANPPASTPAPPEVAAGKP